MRTRAQQQKNSIQNWIRIKDGKKTVRINYLWPLWMWHTSRICSMLTPISLVALQHFSVCIGCVYAHKFHMVWIDLVLFIVSQLHWQKHSSMHIFVENGKMRIVATFNFETVCFAILPVFPFFLPFHFISIRFKRLTVFFRSLFTVRNAHLVVCCCCQFPCADTSVRTQTRQFASVLHVRLALF